MSVVFQLFTFCEAPHPVYRVIDHVSRSQICTAAQLCYCRITLLQDSSFSNPNISKHLCHTPPVFPTKPISVTVIHQYLQASRPSFQVQAHHEREGENLTHEVLDRPSTRSRSQQTQKSKPKYLLDVTKAVKSGCSNTLLTFVRARWFVESVVQRGLQNGGRAFRW